ncbi:MAG: hypothetical protein V3R25_09290 [Nitrosomonadaceae bacterium]
MSIEFRVRQQHREEGHLEQPSGLSDKERDEWNAEAWVIIQEMTQSA